MPPPLDHQGSVSVVGGGPAGLMAAEVLSAAGMRVTVFEHMPSVGRKLLLAGRGGLNITHSEPLERFLGRYGANADLVGSAVSAFTPAALRSWCAGLGEETFVGSSGRVFPRSFRATPLLRAWLQRLAGAGVTIATRHRWVGWATDGSGTPIGTTAVFDHAGHRVEARADAVLLAMGGASWPRVGSDGGWTSVVRAAGVVVHDLVASNAGVRIGWTEQFARRFAGVPLKNVALHVGDVSVRGDAMVTESGLEGGPVYAHSAAIRHALADGSCTIAIDLQPDLDVDEIVQRLAKRPKDSLATALARLGLAPVSVNVLREATANRVPSDPSRLAALVKAVPIVVDGITPIDRAISSAGGIALDEIDGSFMLRRVPGTFVAGEMLDWDAPTGGYLLQASISTGAAAAQGILAAVHEPQHVEVDAGDTLWRFDRRFLSSNWTCIWGRGCHGILAEPAAHLGHGCCSIGAELDGLDEARTVAALADTLSPEVFQHHREASTGGVFRDDTCTNTRVVDGACIFLNRPGHPGGAGCALHLAAVAAGESPLDWKPSVCWQLPIKVDWELRDDDVEVATVRGWERRDWGDDGDTMAWCCTEGAEAYVGDRRVVESLAEELAAVVGDEVYVELRRRMA